MARLARDAGERREGAPGLGEVLAVDVHRHAQHHAGDLLELLVVQRRIEVFGLLSRISHHVTVVAAEAERGGEAPHDPDDLGREACPWGALAGSLAPRRPPAPPPAPSGRGSWPRETSARITRRRNWDIGRELSVRIEEAQRRGRPGRSYRPPDRPARAATASLLPTPWEARTRSGSARASSRSPRRRS